jgi:deoxyribodipyrimidine photo-lyase
MSRDHRVDDHWALLYAQELALEYKQPLIVACPIGIDYPAAPQRQLDFIVDGLSEVEAKLNQFNIPFFVSAKSTVEILYALIREIRAGSVVCDFNPLRDSRQWKSQLSNRIDIPFYEVDSHNIVPAWEASNRLEYAAYTIRPRIQRKLHEFLIPFPKMVKHPETADAFKLPNGWSAFCNSRDIANTEAINTGWKSGEKAALTHLHRFLSARLPKYSDQRNDPTKDGQSGLSPYLHFGQLSAQRVALETQRYDVDIASQESFVEELIVRRELSDNYCYYNDSYDSIEGFPQWAQKTLNEHRTDPRPYLYGRDILETAETHDELWNAAQTEMVATGRMHGYLRMYWAKKILEWSLSAEVAMSHAIYLNNKYELDGNDPNGYAGIAWSIGGVHDRAWQEREIFGKVRYMNYDGCKRKFSVPAYIKRSASLAKLEYV